MNNHLKLQMEHGFHPLKGVQGDDFLQNDWLVPNEFSGSNYLTNAPTGWGNLCDEWPSYKLEPVKGFAYENPSVRKWLQ